MPGWNRPLALVLLGTVATLAVATVPTPLWDEDEARFAAVARAMVETGDWMVPRYNGGLAVDKPVLMHWCMAACMRVFGTNEVAARLPATIATLLTALAVFRAGKRWFDSATGVVAALAYVGCLLVSIEAHAATPDAILTALTTWATLLVADAVLPGRDGRLVTCPPAAAAAAGALLGLAVVCKGPVGAAGPVAVLGAWAWWVAARARGGGVRHLARLAVPAALDAVRAIRLGVIAAATIATAAPWYAAVTLLTDGEWTRGFLLIHNVGRFMAPMERHGGSVVFHPLAMLVGFYPWSCFLPFAVVVAARRVTRGGLPAPTAAAWALPLVWLAVWVGGFSAAATKLPNYVLPAYPAAALVVAAIAVDAARAAAAGRWPHPRWMAAGLASLAFGGVATAVTVVVAARHGLPSAEPAAALGLVPLVGAAACLALARRGPLDALAAFTVTGLVYAAVAVGPVQARIAAANSLPGFVRELQRDRDPARLGTFLLSSPSVVFYAADPVAQLDRGDAPAAARFLGSVPGSVLLLPEPRLAELEPILPAGVGIVGRVRPAFRRHDVVAVARLPADVPRTAAVDAGGTAR